MASTTTRSIMVVDDEMELAIMFRSFLENEGYNAISFVDPVLALEYFKQTSDKPSLIITDLRMPGLCGIDLAKSIRILGAPDIKIFLMTAFDAKDLETSPNYIEARVDKLLQKPIRLSELRTIITELWKT
ncbi:MAG TPA: response regulator [Candidatus Nitrosocosmicus sp.]|nr:response regulator [Candidatus Nitrosocosmicus sp.]